jgi:fatty acid amide hydrolase
VPLGQRAVASQVGVLARRVDDVALGVEIINGGHDPAVEPPMPLGDPRSVDVSRLRVAYYTDDGTFAVAPAVRRAVCEAADVLRSQGAQVAAWSPPDVAYAMELYLGILTADGGRGMAEALGRDKRDPRIATLLMAVQRSRPTLAVLGGLLRLLGQRGLAASLGNFGHRDTHYYWGLVEAQMAYQRRFAEAFDRDEGGPFDLILAPACALPAFRHGASRELMTAGGYTALYNLLGYPAGVAPFTRVRVDEETERAPSRDLVEQAAYRVEQGSAGLPIGVQVIARPWRDHVALAAMRAIEDATRARDGYPMLPPM